MSETIIEFEDVRETEIGNLAFSALTAFDQMTFKLFLSLTFEEPVLSKR